MRTRRRARGAAAVNSRSTITLAPPPARANGRQGGARSLLRSADVVPLAAAGMLSRPARAFLSAAGIALGIATMVAVLGISSSSRARLVAQIDALGTNLLTVSPGGTFGGPNQALPKAAPGMVRRVAPVLSASAIGDVNASVYRNNRIPAVDSQAITVYSADTSLLTTLRGHLARGRFLSSVTSRYPAVVLGAQAASALGINQADGSVLVWLGNHWFSVVGILDPVPLAPELDRTALIGFPVAEQLLDSRGQPAEIYVRADPASLDAVAAVLPATADPAAPQDVAVTAPAAALTARADASAAFQSQFLALGAVALLVGGIGIANVMVIAVLERRSEIGLRRALGASRRHIGVQFVAEAALLAGIGGLAGALLGGFTTTVYAAEQKWTTVIPPQVLLAAVVVAVAVGAVAGLYPALRAARLAPAEALRVV